MPVMEVQAMIGRVAIPEGPQDEGGNPCFELLSRHWRMTANCANGIRLILHLHQNDGMQSAVFRQLCNRHRPRSYGCATI
jgi:hypothetical protein